MLAEALDDIKQLTKWPYLASPKLDGIRCVVKDGVALSRNLTPIKNDYIQSRLGHKKLNGLDGELIVGEPTGEGVMARAQSGVRSKAGKPDFKFYVFDDFSAHGHDFRHRIGRVEDRVDDLSNGDLIHVEHHLVNNPLELTHFEGRALEMGFEGAMLRLPSGPYKYGRSTPLEEYLWKVKRFKDFEVLIKAVVEGSTNTNTLQQDAMGRAKRSTAKSGLIGNGMVGTIVGEVLNGPLEGDIIDVAPGRMTPAERRHYFLNPKELVGQIANVRAFMYGMKDKPRFATFQSLRDREHMGKVAQKPNKARKV